MRKKREISIVLFALMAVVFGLSSCVKNYYYECDGNSDSTTNGGTTTGKSYMVKFSALVNKVKSTTRTTSATPLQQDRYVTVYTFQGQGDEIAETSYKTLQSGVLSPVSGDLSLPIGTYDFYSLSIGNQSTYPPTVTNMDTGIVHSLSNGLDYLTCVMESEAISGPTTIDLTFNHVASQVMVIVVSGSSTTTVDSIYSATISQPTISSSSPVLDLFTGEMTSATALSSTPISMAITDSLCQQILLPLKYSGNLTMNFQAYVNGASSPMNYSVGIPLVNSELASGSSYEYKVVISEDVVSVATASVNPWTEVNETGSPLTPTPQ